MEAGRLCMLNKRKEDAMTDYVEQEEGKKVTLVKAGLGKTGLRTSCYSS
jgi:hypothetical protein